MLLGRQVYPYGLERLAQYQAGGDRQYFLADALGSVRQMVDINNQVTLSRSAPYGEVISSSGSGGTPYGFTGEWTAGSGQVYLRARWYAPKQGRFISRDRCEGDYNLPMSYNKWLYVYSNPVNLTDPSGKFPGIPICPSLNPLDCLSFFGAIPDYKGIVIVELFELFRGDFANQRDYITSRGLHPTTIAAAIAVQSQWLDFPLAQLQEALVYTKRSGCIPENEAIQKLYKVLKLDSAGIGYAQSGFEYGDPYMMPNAIKAMTERIVPRIQYCVKAHCRAKDRLIASAMAQNGGFTMDGYVFKDFTEPMPNSDEVKIVWQEYFDRLTWLDGSEDTINNVRAIGRTNFDTRFMLQLFTQNMIVLNAAFKWELPPEIYMTDLLSMMKLAVFNR